MTEHDLLLTASDGTTRATAEIDLACGGRVRQVSIERGGTSVDLLASSADAREATSTSWGSFPMAPWAGRLRHGRFVVDGRVVSLDLNHQDGGGGGIGLIDPPGPALDDDPVEGSVSWRQHAIHGTTFQRPWLVDEADPDRCELHCPIDTVAGWPFSGTARQSIRIHPDRIDFALAVEAAPDLTFPAAIGWHPWFAKPVSLDAALTSMYVRDNIGLPTGELIEPPPGPWDDCFLTTDPVRLVYERAVAPVVTVSSDCDHLVVFDMPAHATCVEPQSGPPDAPNLRPELVSTEMPLRRTMRWSW